MLVFIRCSWDAVPFSLSLSLPPFLPSSSPGKCVALDCEMVGTGPNGDFSMLARCSVVNHHGNILYDSYVAPMDTVTDYRTVYSGVRPQDLKGGKKSHNIHVYIPISLPPLSISLPSLPITKPP